MLALFPAQIRAMLGPHDLAGHFGAASLLLLLERGNAATPRPGARAWWNASASTLSRSASAA